VKLVYVLEREEENKSENKRERERERERERKSASHNQAHLSARACMMEVHERGFDACASV